MVTSRMTSDTPARSVGRISLRDFSGSSTGASPAAASNGSVSSRRRPFERAMVSAGTLGAAYASIEDVVAQLGDIVDALMAGRTVDAQYPQYWRVAINESVARSLDVIVDASARGLGNFHD